MIKTNIGGTNVIDIFILILNIDSSTPHLISLILSAIMKSVNGIKKSVESAFRGLE